MERTSGARLLSQWDQLPLVAVFALAIIFVAEVGEAPPIALFGGAMPTRYMSPWNLWREALVIGGFTWGLLWMMGASLFFFARSESGGILSILEPVRGTLPTGMLALFFGLMASLSRGRAWVYVGLGLLAVCTLAGLSLALKRLPHLSPLNVGGESPGGNMFGFFRFCRDDPRRLLPRRGGGVALNLAHGGGWGILLLGMVLPLGLAAFASLGGLF
jgi:hypothetical protein